MFFFRSIGSFLDAPSLALVVLDVFRPVALDGWGVGGAGWVGGVGGAAGYASKGIEPDRIKLRLDC